MERRLCRYIIFANEKALEASTLSRVSYLFAMQFLTSPDHTCTHCTTFDIVSVFAEPSAFKVWVARATHNATRMPLTSSTPTSSCEGRGTNGCRYHDIAQGSRSLELRSVGYWIIASNCLYDQRSIAIHCHSMRFRAEAAPCCKNAWLRAQVILRRTGLWRTSWAFRSWVHAFGLRHHSLFVHSLNRVSNEACGLNSAVSQGNGESSSSASCTSRIIEATSIRNGLCSSSCE